jgi:hypothetical protein
MTTTTRGRYAALTRRQSLGARLQPRSVTDAWYEAGCPQSFVPSVSLRVRLQWRLACWLRGAEHPQPLLRKWLPYAVAALVLFAVLAWAVT